MIERSSRLRHFLMMLPFFLIGVAVPVYYFGFSGDGPPTFWSTNKYSPVPTVAPNPDGYNPASPDYRPSEDPHAEPRADRGIVAFTRSLFENAVDQYVSPGLSPLTIKLGLFAIIFVAVVVIVRVALAALTGVLGGFLSFLVHKAAAPMFMGFLAVGSTWGIHQTVAEQFGMSWAAATVTLTAAVASLFALAGVRIR